MPGHHEPGLRLAGQAARLRGVGEHRGGPAWVGRPDPGRLVHEQPMRRQRSAVEQLLASPHGLNVAAHPQVA